MTFRAFLYGDVMLLFHGGDPAFLLDHLIKGGFSLREPRLSQGGLLFSLPPIEIRHLRTYLFGKGYRFHILRKSGMPFLLKKAFSRKGLWAGCLLILIISYILSSFIWTVDITGVSPDTAEKIRSYLSGHGLSVGVLSSSIEPAVLRSLLLEEVDELDWAAVNLLGSRAWIQAVESPPLIETEYLSREAPSDLVACKSGYLLESRIILGETLVFPGSTVSQGDILASHVIHGMIPGTQEFSGVVRFVHASGVAIARTQGQVSAVVSACRMKKSYTNQSYTHKSLLFAKRPNFFFKNYGIPYALCDKIEERYPLVLPGGQELPLSLIKSRYEAYSLTEIRMERKVAGDYLEALITRQLLSEAKDGVIESLQTVLYPEGDLWRMDADYIMTEDIGRVISVTPDP